ncbi:hypothetical protein EDB83DRAFT_2385131 [Lactarius deliciosus]|nr:hypothetical protein EDB83DRAFT_2385131 [Lactarius deliciosus]
MRSLHLRSLSFVLILPSYSSLATPPGIFAPCPTYTPAFLQYNFSPQLRALLMLYGPPIHVHYGGRDGPIFRLRPRS